TALTGRDFKLDTRKLSGTAGLFLMGVIDFNSFTEGFTISHLRSTNIGFHFEFALHAINQNVEVKLAHALDDRLTGFVVGGYLERGIFRSQTVQSNAHLFL